MKTFALGLALFLAATPAIAFAQGGGGGGGGAGGASSGAAGAAGASTGTGGAAAGGGAGSVGGTTSPNAGYGSSSAAGSAGSSTGLTESELTDKSEFGTEKSVRWLRGGFYRTYESEFAYESEFSNRKPIGRRGSRRGPPESELARKSQLSNRYKPSGRFGRHPYGAHKSKFPEHSELGAGNGERRCKPIARTSKCHDGTNKSVSRWRVRQDRPQHAVRPTNGM